MDALLFSPTHARESHKITQRSSETYLMENIKHCASLDTKSQHTIEVCRASQHTQREREPAVLGDGLTRGQHGYLLTSLESAARNLKECQNVQAAHPEKMPEVAVGESDEGLGHRRVRPLTRSGRPLPACPSCHNHADDVQCRCQCHETDQPHRRLLTRTPDATIGYK